MPIEFEASDDEAPEEIPAGWLEYEKCLTILKDGCIRDESFDPKHLDKVMKNDFFLNHLYNDGNLECSICDEEGWLYDLVDGECVKNGLNVCGKSA
tara:strand:- start:460 stop:747 length:288 start_codon:yes stop_codon:yes gene_type:complete